ncbi:DnaB-like helicase C-terminal domain-containing protein [Streptosporangium saharense]|uniref:Replicative DNA helicase n=1 Tax=Streptosporangium saharense TaxID=1706840 RepID=A0A7W7QK30_9ACTN|nr:DnaB-like helicase C-terminal domain-containing protein [Streptosporangium saharense]MBB4914987.1 replicative DNA helicase [Streptosporangium saharense]
MPYDPAPAPAREEFLGLLDHLDATDRHTRPSGHVLTGLNDLDSLTLGLEPGTLTVVASRPGVGSTTLLLAFCRGMALVRDTSTLLVSYEASRRDLLTRIVSTEARVVYYALRSGHLTDDDRAKLARVVPRLAEAPLHLAAPADWTLSELGEHITRACATGESAVRVVAVDGLRHIRPDVRGDTQERETTEIVQTLKALAVRLDIPIVVTTDLDLPPGADPRQPPNLYTDLCGAVARAADLVILVHREDADGRDSPRAGEADLIVAKHRSGPVATVTVAFQGHYSRFVDMRTD